MTPEREQEIRWLSLHDENTHRGREVRDVLAALDATRQENAELKRLAGTCDHCWCMFHDVAYDCDCVCSNCERPKADHLALSRLLKGTD